MTRGCERRETAPRRRFPATARATALAVAGLLACAGCGGTGRSTVPPTTAPAAVRATPQALAQTMSPELSARLDQAITQVMRQAAVPGVIVGVWSPGGGSYQRAFGVADRNTGTPMSTNLNMRIGSETKTFVVTGILQLADEGRLGLDDPVSKYLPGVPQGDGITLRDLARMQSGLFDYTHDPAFVNALISNPTRAFTPQELLGYAFGHPLDFPPGKQLEYSDTNTVVLGLVLQNVSGQSVGDYLRQHVLRPSHLDHTLFPTGAEFPVPRASGYTVQTPTGAVADATGWNSSWAWAAGAMISNLDDLHAWAPILANGSLLKPATQAQRLETVSSGSPDIGYGMGLFTDHGWVGHNGSLPGYQSLTLYLPSSRTTLVVLLNTDTSSQGSEPSTLLGQAITGIVTPDHVFSLPAAPQSASPRAS